MAGRWDRPQRGALAAVTYQGVWKDLRTAKGVVESVERGEETVVGMDLHGSWSELRFDPDSDNFGVIDLDGDERELYQFHEVVPPSQVRHPGIEPGDTVKIGTGTVAYRVEAVEDGMVLLEDDRRIPVTEVTAFDEDVDDYDPLNILPGSISDLFGGGR